MSTRSKQLLLIAALVLASGVALAAYRLSRPLTVVIHNSDARALEGVVVEAGGRTAQIGRIEPGACGSAQIRPRCTSSVEVTFVDTATGKRATLNADCYIENGFSGKIEIWLNGTQILKKNDNTSVY